MHDVVRVAPGVGTITPGETAAPVSNDHAAAHRGRDHGRSPAPARHLRRECGEAVLHDV